MKHNWRTIIDESFLNDKPLESVLESVYQQGKEDAIKEMKGFIVDHGLYVTFKASEWAEQIKEQNHCDN